MGLKSQRAGAQIGLPRKSEGAFSARLPRIRAERRSFEGELGPTSKWCLLNISLSSEFETEVARLYWGDYDSASIDDSRIEVVKLVRTIMKLCQCARLYTKLCLAREAGVSVKPGARAPGSIRKES